MDRLEVHERIVASEFYWYGGVLDVPKVYDADGHYHTEPAAKGQWQVAEQPAGRVLDVSEVFDRVADREWLSSLLSNQ